MQPEPPETGRRRLLAAVLAAAGALTLVIVPMPWRLAIACAAIGALGGALLLPRAASLAIAAYALFIFGVKAAGEWLAPDLPSLWWQPYVVALAAMLTTCFLPGTVRDWRRRRRAPHDGRRGERAPRAAGPPPA
jgi:hypothetical protein